MARFFLFRETFNSDIKSILIKKKVNLEIISLNYELKEIELKGKALQEKESITEQLEQKSDQLEQSLIEIESSSKDKKIELIGQKSDKQDEIEKHESEVNKEGEFNELIGFSEARWQLAQLQSMIVAVVETEKRNKRINTELNKAQDELVANKEQMSEIKRELEEKKT